MIGGVIIGAIVGVLIYKWWISKEKPMYIIQLKIIQIIRGTYNFGRDIVNDIKGKKNDSKVV